MAATEPTASDEASEATVATTASGRVVTVSRLGSSRAECRNGS